MADKKWKKMLASNLAFLNGKSRATFYHGGPLDEESTAMIPDLRRLNKRGVFTHDSQPPDAQQRSYLEFVVTAELWSKLSAPLLAHPDIYVEYGMPQDSFSTTHNVPAAAIPSGHFPLCETGTTRWAPGHVCEYKGGWQTNCAALHR